MSDKLKKYINDSLKGLSNDGVDVLIKAMIYHMAIPYDNDTVIVDGIIRTAMEWMK